jgi:aspartate racemase
VRSLEALLSHLNDLDIRVRVDAGRLHVNAPRGALTPELQTELAERKLELLAFVEEAGRVSGPGHAPIPRAPREGVLPLSFAQERLWFFDQLEPGIPAYHIPMALRLTGALDVSALERSLSEIVRRHEPLRTAFPVLKGKPVQDIAPAVEARLPVVDLGSVPLDDREAHARRLTSEEARRPFDLARGPLVRATLFLLEEEVHILLLTMHHIVSDAWSMGIFFRELVALYGAYSAGKPSPLRDLPIQYADFAVWQREWLQGEVLDAHLSYWKEQLAGAPALLELPTDRPRPPEQGFGGAWESAQLPEWLSESLRALSRQEGATLFMTLLAAFQVLLSRYSRQDDIVVGTPIANRNRFEIEDLIGFFVNTLVLRSDLSGNPTFRELLRRVREVCLEAYEHQDLPFERLVQELRPERNLSYSPVFQVMFAVQNAPRRRLELPNLRVTWVGVEGGTAKFDLALSVVEGKQGLGAAFEYKRDLFDRATIGRMLGHYRTLLEGIVEDPDRRISLLPLLTEEERREMLVTWNDTRRDYPRDVCVHELVEAQAERTPDAIAVVFGDRRLTYCELNARANQLAHYLGRRGVGPEVRVGLCVERSLEMVVGHLGILKAGGAFVPLAPTQPRGRLSFMLDDTRAPVLLIQEHLVEDLSPHGVDVVCLDTDWTKIEEESREDPVNVTMPENLAYVTYTSGSTGRPKGVQIHHRGLCNLLLSSIQSFGVGDTSRLAQINHFGFDGVTWECFMALTSGAALYLGSEDDMMAGRRLSDWLRRTAIDTAVVIPSVLNTISDEEYPALHTLVTGAETVSREVAARWSPERRFFNTYGPTEVSISATVLESSDTSRRPPIGRPIANTECYALDWDLQPVPVGVPGELYIGGAGLARGYLNSPGLTAERFIPHPFAKEAGGRLYRTGDLCRYLPDGNIDFLGRLDHQVKVRGLRIELGEIETVLAAHPAVRQAVALVRGEHASGTSVPVADRRLVAYIVPASETLPGVTELRRHLREELPQYMVPSRFVMLPSIPLTSSGKFDRQALPPPDETRPDLEEGFVAPRTRLESAIARVWREALGVDQVGVYDNFFDLGGHSLMAVQVIYRLEAELGIQFGPRDLIFQTLGQLASSAEMRMHPSQPSQPIGFLQKVWRAIRTASSPGSLHRE